MDRRKQKTQEAIFDAFTELVGEKDYSSITIQEIIDRANVGRSTFYTHFQTKEDLAESLCKMLYNHIFESADCGKHVGSHTHRDLATENKASSIFSHIIHHLEENDHNLLTLLSCDTSGIFTSYFKSEMNELLRKEFHLKKSELPEDFLINHIATTFLETIQWWLKNGKKESSEQLHKYFFSLIQSLL